MGFASCGDQAIIRFTRVNARLFHDEADGGNPPRVAIVPFHGTQRMENDMSGIDGQQWEKELRSLLDQVRAHPSRDLTEERQRIAVLKNLIATRGKAIAA